MEPIPYCFNPRKLTHRGIKTSYVCQQKSGVMSFFCYCSEAGTDLTPLVITLTMIGKFAMTAAFGTVVLYAPEIYPTNLR